MLHRLRALVTSSALVYFASTILARGASFFLIPLYTRRLTPVEYGDYTLGQTVLGTLPWVMSLSLPTAVSRFYFDTADAALGNAQAGTVGRWHLLLVTLVSLLLLGVLLVFCPASGTPIGGRWELSCILIACAGSALSIFPSGYFRTVQRPLWVAAFQLAEFAAVVVAGLTFVNVLGRGVTGAFEAWAAAYGLLGLVGAVFILTLPGSWSPTLLKRALRFSLPFVPHLLANQLQNIADRWTLKASGLDAQLGSYALACQVASPASLLVASYNDGASPRMGEALRDGGVVGIERTIGAVRRRYLLVAVGGALLVMAAIPIAKMLIAPRFHGALWLSPFICAVILIESLYFPNVNVLYFSSETRIIPTVTFSAAALNVALNIAFIRYAGVPGAILARAISMTYRTVAVWLAARACFRRAASAAVVAAAALPIEAAAK